MFDRNTWNQLTMCKQMNSGSFKMLPTNYSVTNHLIVYKQMTDVKLDC